MDSSDLNPYQTPQAPVEPVASEQKQSPTDEYDPLKDALYFGGISLMVFLLTAGLVFVALLFVS